MTTATIKNHEHITFARKCSQCNEGMNEGYCIGGGDNYYCSPSCLHKNYSAKKWLEMYEDNECENYWTAWDIDDHIYYVNEVGDLCEI